MNVLAVCAAGGAVGATPGDEEAGLDLPALVERALRRDDGALRRSVVGPVAEALLLDGVAAEAAGPLAGLHGVAGLRRSLARTFTALGMLELPAATLARLSERVRRGKGLPEGSQAGSLPARLAELGRLYQRYRSLLGAGRLDAALACGAGLRALGGAATELIGDADVVVLTGLHRVPPWDARPTLGALLQALAALAGGGDEAAPTRLVRVVLPTVDGGPAAAAGDGAGERPLLDGALRPLLDAIYQRHALNVEVEWAALGPHVAGAAAETPWGRFLRGLFLPLQARPLVAPGELPDGRLQLSALPSPAAEARQVARAIRDLLSTGVPPAELAVIVESPVRRARLIAELLRYDVPVAAVAALPRPSGVLPARDSEPLAPPLALLLGIYELLGERPGQGLPREGLIQLLTSRYLRWPLVGEGGSARPWQLARALRGAGVRDLGLLAGGETTAELHRRIEEWLRQQRPAKGAGTDGEPPLLHHLEAILGELRSLPPEGTVAEHVTALRRLCERLELRRQAASPAATWLARQPIDGGDGEDATEESVSLLAAECRALARDQAALALLDQVLDELPHRAQQLRLDGVSLPRLRFAALLEQALYGLAAVLSTAPAGGPGVEVGSLQGLRPRSWSHLFVLGMLDGELPAPAGEDPLLDDDERRLCNRLLDAPVFPLAQHEGGRAALLFAEALAHAAAVHLSWPIADEEGRPLLRSSFVETVLHAAARPEPAPSPEGLVPTAGNARHPVELWTRAARGTGPAGAEQAAPLFTVLAARDRQRARRLSQRIEIEGARAAWFTALAAGRSDVAPGPLSGQLTDGATITALAPRLPGSRTRPLSASALEDYARCPFRFFVYRVLQAAPIPEGGDDIDPLARGNLYHKALENFFADRRDQGRLPLRGDDDDRRALDRALDGALADFASAERSGHPALFQIRLRRLRAELWQLIVRESQAPLEPGLQPALLEHKFGPLAITAAEGGDTDTALHIGGIIDRIDIGPGRALVLDYKTGRIGRYQEYLRGELLQTSFQLPLYAAAAQADPAVLAAAGGAAPPHVTARYYAVRQAQVTEALDAPQLIALDPDARRQAGSRNVAEAAYHLWRQLRGGDFRVAPRTCDGCGLESVCRIAVPPIPPAGDRPDEADDESRSSPPSSRSTPSGSGAAQTDRP